MPNKKKTASRSKKTRGASLAQSMKRNLIDIGKAGLDAVIKRAGHNLIRAATKRLRNNPKSWYVKYRDITPAANKNRPMEARFNKTITTNASNGSVAKFIELHLGWTDITNSFMWEQMITNSYQLLRLKLKSNLPYTRNFLSAYVHNAMQALIIAKQIERDVHWYNYSDPSCTNFQDMFMRRATQYGTFGVQKTDIPKMYSLEWPETVTAYERLVSTVGTNIRVAPSLTAFISHYFGSVFSTECDGFNDNYLILRMMEQEWAEYDSATDTIKMVPLNIEDLTIDDFAYRVMQLGIQFGMVISDLVNSEQYESARLDSLDHYYYDVVYDETLLQAIRNGYTSKSAVTEQGYVRIDQSFGVEDDLTQYIFMGALQPSSISGSDIGDLSQVPAIRVLSMALKYDSDADLTWAGSYVQQIVDAAEGESTIPLNATFDAPFAVIVNTDIQEDVYALTNTEISYTGATQTGDGLIRNAYYDGFRVQMYDDENALVSDTATSGSAQETDPQTIVSVSATNLLNGKILGNFTDMAGKTYYYYVPLYWYSQTHQTDLVQNATALIALQIKVEVPAKITDTPTVSLSLEFIQRRSMTESEQMDFDTWAEIDASLGATRLQTALSGAQNRYAGIGTSSITGNMVPFVASVTPVQVKGFQFNITLTLAALQSQLLTLEGGNNIAYFVNLVTQQGSSTKINLGAYLKGWMSSAFAGYASIVQTGFKYELSGTAADNASIMTSTVTLGYLGLHSAVMQDINAYIPMYPKQTIHLRNVSIGPDTLSSRNEITATVQLPLMKKEHMPYWYNIQDLKPVIYDMFTSLFTPADDIYTMLTLRKGGEKKDQDRRRRNDQRKGSKDGSKESTNREKEEKSKKEEE